MFRIGIGYDVHQLVTGRDLILGGVVIPHSHGLLGHSDADVLAHALMDALLGAMNLGTIGDFFPDTDKAYKDISSMVLLDRVVQRMKADGYRLVNADSVVVAQAPKLAPHIPAIKASLAKRCHVDVGCISVKATTSEWLGFEGREEGMSSQAVVLLSRD